MARILIVDDDADVLESNQIILEFEGHEVVAAHDRPESLRHLAEGTPDLILADLVMDEPHDGLALAREARAAGVNAPIILLTGMDHRSIAHALAEDGSNPVNGWLEKPVDPVLLLRTVRKWVEQ